MSNKLVKGPTRANFVLSDDNSLLTLFGGNRAWAASKTLTDPRFFDRLVDQQRPRYFWIGCSDSPVPATEIVNLDPGEMFVHRNVANLASASDQSFSAALQFAVDVLRVQHIMVVGHYGCGGIEAAMNVDSEDAIGHWLAPVRTLYRHSCQDDSGQLSANALCEQNIFAQVEALAVNPIVRAAWSQGASLELHGWIYAIEDGLLRPLCGPVRAPGTTGSSAVPAAPL